MLGNTGSGKSCSVAGLIRWSLEQAKPPDGSVPNARFIVLDPNGEYSRAFKDDKTCGKARIFKVAPESGGVSPPGPTLVLEYAEWCCFTQATVKTQKPTLIQALRAVRDGQTEPAASKSHEIRRFLRTILSTIRIEKNSGSPWGSFPKPKAFFEKLDKWRTGLEPEQAGLVGDELTHLTALVKAMEALCTPRKVQYPSYDFTHQEIETLLAATSAAHSAFGGSEGDTMPSDVEPHSNSKGIRFCGALKPPPKC